MAPAVPHVEIADYADALGVRRPYGKADSAYAFEFMIMGSEFIVDAVMVAFFEKVKVVIG